MSDEFANQPLLLLVMIGNDSVNSGVSLLGILEVKERLERFTWISLLCLYVLR